MIRHTLLGCFAALAAAAAALATPLSPGDLRLIGALEIPKALEVDGAPFGGISGIDYDPKTDEWLMISDDKSDLAPARFYVGRLDFDAKAVSGLRLERVVSLRREDGSTFPSAREPSGERADAESIRIDPDDGGLLWSTEGDPQRGFDPAIRRMDRQGNFQGAVALPDMFSFRRSARPNQTLEGLSLSADGRTLWAAMEGPLIQDGPVSTISQAGVVRLTRLDRQGRIQAQHAYRLDPVQAAPARRGDNGISEILTVDERQLLILERSGVEDAQGRFIFHCRLYVVDISGALDISGEESLANGDTRPLTKRLLVNFDRLPEVAAANLEAMAWGPVVGGRRTLVLMADDNFDPTQRGQVVVFTIAARS